MSQRGDEVEIDEGCGVVGLGMSYDDMDMNVRGASTWSSNSIPSSSSTPIDSSNIGFQLLKKHGWKEGTGLGISEQGRLEPVEAYAKTNKRGLGADKVKKEKEKHKNPENDSEKNAKLLSKRETKAFSKKVRKMKEFEQRLKEKEFERAFFREFWPDNV